jgi:exonuclease III
VVVSGFMEENILVWNVRGLNSRANHNVVHELVVVQCLSLVCLQETKLESITDFDVIQLVGIGFDYVFVPAVQTRGGILVAFGKPLFLAEIHELR